MDGAGLATALVAFQAECPKVDFDGHVKTNKYDFKYSTLGNLITKTKPILAKHGLSIIQFPAESEKEDHISVRTIILHKSGDHLEGICTLKIPRTRYRSGDLAGQLAEVTPQDQGSAISYARRYAYASSLSLVSENDNDALPMGDLYQGATDDKKWLRDVCKELGVIDQDSLKTIHTKLIKANATKDKNIVKSMIV